MMDYQNWWEGLESQWQQGFGEAFFGHKIEPSKEEIEQLFQSPALRLAGPTSAYPNMSFELTNLSGIVCLTNLNIFVCTHHQIKSIEEIANLPHLKSLFLFNNEILSLAGIEGLAHLEQLYVQFNELESIQTLASLTQLKELYIHDNKIATLEGITEAHAENLEVFFCTPNQGLKQKEVLRIEREFGIICRKY